MTTTPSAPTWVVSRKTGPTTRPVSVAELKQALLLPLSETHHDPQLALNIDAATEQFEADTGLACIESTFVYVADRFPTAGGAFRLPRQPLQSIVEIRYLDPDQQPAVVDPDSYRIVPGEALVRLAVGGSWPDYTLADRTVEIEFVAGFGATAESVSERCRGAVRTLAGYYANLTPDAPTFAESYRIQVQSLLPVWPQGSEP